ncbi:MAG: hypothetical protein JWN08_726, partial [Frankiales bacterium]|nr:hypothetical protein [Frankiales bacterium]
RDVDGSPVAGVDVFFSETGAGAFRNGNSNAFGTTNAAGVATAEVISLPGELGTQTVRAEIFASETQCENAANVGTDPQGNNLNTTTNTGAAGVCADTSTVTFSNTPASPSATPTAGTCTTPAQVTIQDATIIATGAGRLSVDAPANSIIELEAYTRPSTTYRVVRRAEINAAGDDAQFTITPPANTRLRARVVGCAFGDSKVMNVRTALSIFATRTGVKTYRFSGDSLPARPGGLIVSLYRVTASGSQVLTAQTRASATTGDWVINRTFTGTGRFGFVVRTGQDLQNAPGASNVRPTQIY